MYTLWIALDSPIGKDPRLPLTLRDFPGFRDAPASYSFTANGYRFVAVAGAGRDVSQADLRALEQMISSVRFKPVRTGEITNGYYVLKRPSAYPVGTITRIRPPKFLPDHRTRLWPFYLIHDRRGLRAVGWQSPPCNVALDRARGQFFCPGGGRWDSFGNTMANPPGAKQIEPLESYATTVSQGHLLVNEFVQYQAGCAHNLARRLRACPNYQPVSSSSRTS